MKRLFSVSIILLLILCSCRTALVVEGDRDSLYYESLLNEKESMEVRYNYLYALYEENSYEKILADVDKAISLYPEYTRFIKLKALAARETGDTALYSEALSLVLENEPYDEELRNLYLDSLLDIGKTDEAFVFSKETLKLFPDNVKALTLLSGESPFYSYLLSLKDTSLSQV